MKNQNLGKKEIKEIPRSLKIISIFFYVLAALILIHGVELFVTRVFFQGNSILDSMIWSEPSPFVMWAITIFGLGLVDVLSILVNRVSNFLNFPILNLLILGAIALLFFFFIRCLLKGKKWARIVAVIIAAVGFIYNIFVPLFIQSLIVGGLPFDFRAFFMFLLITFSGLAINALIIGYLLFDKRIKEVFV